MYTICGAEKEVERGRETRRKRWEEIEGKRERKRERERERGKEREREVERER